MRRIALLVAAALVLQGQTARDLRIERTPTTLPDKTTRWALVVGVSSYKYAPPEAQLRFAHRDAAEFARFLRSTAGGSFPAGNVRLLTNETATLASIRSALHNWLPKGAAATDVVYVFFAGHAVANNAQQAFFVAHDSDPQNLQATALSFAEVNDALTRRMRASLVVLFADACHAGGIGWTSDPKSYSRAHGPLESIGSQDRTILKLLASRPSERSYEDERWGGGHGVFTYSVLNGLRGAADRERDGVVRAAELIEYVSRIVPDQTGKQQTPRVAGNFEGGLPMAVLHNAAATPDPQPARLTISGPPGTAVYLDAVFQGVVRPSGELAVERLSRGPHVLSFDVAGLGSIEHRFDVTGGPVAIEIEKLAAFGSLRIEAAMRAGRILGPAGALELFRAMPPAQKAAAESLVAAGLEQLGQDCISDYVQSTTNSLKRPMFLRAVEAFTELRTFRSQDSSLTGKALFCRARAEIAAGQFAAAVQTLQQSLAALPDFACSYNALGVAYQRLNQDREARQAFEKARDLAPEWALPPLELARQRLAAGDLNGAVPHLEQSARMHPVNVGVRWVLARTYRLLGRGQQFLDEAAQVTKLDPNYAPIYADVGLHHESTGQFVEAARAFDTYLLLAPNYADSAEIRTRAQRVRNAGAPKKPPTLRR